MNAQTKIQADLDADSHTVTEAMRLLNVRRIENWGLGHFLVELTDGRMGAGINVSEAYRKAKDDCGLILPEKAA